jgi:hypothetical protein
MTATITYTDGLTLPNDTGNCYFGVSLEFRGTG